MNWVQFPSGTLYTFAPNIQRFAEEQGYRAPCEADGTKHPGTDCNSKMRTVCKSAGMRRTFNIDEKAVIDIYVDKYEENAQFLDWLIRNNIVSSSYKKHKVIQLYSKNAVNAILSVMLNVPLEYDTSGDSIFPYSGAGYCSLHNFELKKNKPKASLFKKGGQ